MSFDKDIFKDMSVEIDKRIMQILQELRTARIDAKDIPEWDPKEDFPLTSGEAFDINLDDLKATSTDGFASARIKVPPDIHIVDHPIKIFGTGGALTSGIEPHFTDVYKRLVEISTKAMGETDMIKVMCEDPTDPELMFKHTDVLKLEGTSKRDDRPVFRILDRKRFETIKPELEKLGSIEFVDDYEMMDADDMYGDTDGIGDT